ncbi:MAG: DinB family protein [Anaerolineaceae bacterium]|nr:DinB family protein [Anaerolineaceae bacterium]
MQQRERDACIERIRRLPAQLRALVADLDEAQLSAHTIPGEWNVAQNVHHLADSHMYAFLQVRSGLTADNPLIGNYEQDRFAALADSKGPPVTDSLDLLEALHARWVNLWRSLDDSQFARRTRLMPDAKSAAAGGQARTRTLDGNLASYAQHGDDHLDQIRRTIEAGQAATEA